MDFESLVDDLRRSPGSMFSWFSLELLLRSSSKLGLLERFREVEEGCSELENLVKRALDMLENGDISRSRIIVLRINKM